MHGTRFRRQQSSKGANGCTGLYSLPASISGYNGCDGGISAALRPGDVVLNLEMHPLE